MKKYILAALVAVCFIGFSLTAEAQDKTTRLPSVVENYQIGKDAYVRALKIDRSRNVMWVGTSVGAMEIDLDKQDLKNVYTRKEGLANEYVFAIGVDKENDVWLGTNAGGVSKSKVGGGWETYFPMHGLADYWVYSFAFDKDDNAWIGTWDGVSFVDAKTGKFTTYRNELINIWVYGIDIDSKGRVWFGTEGGVSMFDGKNWPSWTHADGLGAPNIDDLERSTNTGLGTRSRHDVEVESATGAETYNPNYVFAVHVDDRDEQIWFGTWGGGVTRYDGKDTWTAYSVREGLAGGVVYSIAQEKDGTLWFGTNKGVTRYDGKTWTTFDQHTGILGNNVFALEIDDAGNIWVGTKGGVSLLSYDTPQKNKAQE